MANGAALAAKLNGDCHSAAMDRAALDAALRAQGEDFFRQVTEQCPHLFAAAPLFVSAAQVAQMRGVIAAVEQVVRLPGWLSKNPLSQIVPHLNPDGTTSHSTKPASGQVAGYLPLAGEEANVKGNLQSLGVFMGYDFHLNADGAHLIEINTNAGGAFLNDLLLQSQRAVALPGEAAALDNLEQIFLDMFRNEWRLERGAVPLQTVAIVDEQPERQYLYPEFVLAQRMFERGGIAALIADPADVEARADGLYCHGRKTDLIYNRLTDFSLQQHAVLRQAYLDGSVVVTPNPAHYARYADKRNLVRLSDADGLRALGVIENAILTLQTGVPQTHLVEAAGRERWWQERKQWFFKPAAGYGGKGSYNGAKLTKRVFEEIMQGGYVAQRLAAPSERMVCMNGAEPAPLKSDVRCYVYAGQIQLVAARLYQGQTTNFRTPGGGFALVRLVG